MFKSEAQNYILQFKNTVHDVTLQTEIDMQLLNSRPICRDFDYIFHEFNKICYTIVREIKEDRFIVSNTKFSLDQPILI